MEPHSKWTLGIVCFLSMILWRVIQLLCSSLSFLLIAEWCSVVWLDHVCAVTYPSRDICLFPCFWLLHIKLWQTFVYRFLCDPKFSFLWDKGPGVRFLGGMVVTCLAFAEAAKVFFRLDVLGIPNSNGQEIPFLHILSAFGVVPNFYFSHPDRCVLISPWDFNMCFSNAWWGGTSFHVFVCHCIFSWVKYLFMSFVHFLIELFY